MSDTSDSEIFHAELGNIQADFQDENWQGFDFEPRRQDYPELYENEWGNHENAPDSSSESGPNSLNDGEDDDRNGNSDWCLCDNCTAMPTRAESICCKEMDALTQKCDEAVGGCVIDHPDFIRFTARVILENTLWVIHHTRNDPFDVDNPRSLRWAAFKQFTAWVYGRLGHRVRRVIPACAVTWIREQYPNQPGEDYTGFIDAMDLDNIFD